MKKNTNTSTLYYVAAILFYLSALIGFARDSNTAVVWFCLGSTFLSLGAASAHKSKSDSSEEE